MRKLCVGLVVRSVFGPASVVLSVHNRPYPSLPAVAASMASLFIANLALVPPFGLLGASFAALIAIRHVTRAVPSAENALPGPPL